MKFMITFEMHPDQRHDAYKTFAQMTAADDEADRGGVQQIGRWHDLGAARGVVICESDDLGAVQAWAMNWNTVLDVEITPVLDDDEARATLKKKFSLE
jgi:hypothetical protein